MAHSWLKKISLGLLLVSFVAVLPLRVLAEEPGGTGGTKADGAAPVNSQGQKPPSEADEITVKDLATTFGLMKIFAGTTDQAIKLQIFFSDSVNEAINSANLFILNLVNLFYILVLLIIAIATIFDWQPYSARALLPRLVIAILLSNFGLFFVKAIADASQILADGVAGGPEGSVTLASAITESVSTAQILKQTVVRAAGIVAAWFSSGISVPLSFLYEATLPTNWFTVAFMATTVVFWLRIVGIWVLAIFAPFGVAFGVIPATQGYSKTYWRKVISYSFVGPLMIFFIRLAGIVFERLNQVNELGTNYLGQYNQGATITSNEYVRDALVATILFVGIVMTKKLGVEVANFTIGAFQKAFKGAFAVSTLFAGAGLAMASSKFATRFAGGSIGNFMARRGWSETSQKNAGVWGQAFFSPLKGNALIGRFAGRAESAFKGLEEKQVKASPRTGGILPAIISRNSAIDKAYRGMTDTESSRRYWEGEASNLPQFLRQIMDENDPNKRAAMANYLLANDKLSSEGFVKDGETKVLKLDHVRMALGPENADFFDVLRAKVASSADPTAAATVDKEPQGSKARFDALVKQLQTMGEQGSAGILPSVLEKRPEILEAMQVAFAPSRTQRAVGIDPMVRIAEKWDIRRKRGAATGYETLADRTTNVQKHMTYLRQSEKLGGNPLKLYSDERFDRLGFDPAVTASLKSAAKTLEKLAVESPDSYKNQTVDVQIQMGQRLDAIGNVDKWSEIGRVAAKAAVAGLKKLAKEDKLPNLGKFVAGGMLPDLAVK